MTLGTASSIYVKMASVNMLNHMTKENTRFQQWKTGGKETKEGKLSFVIFLLFSSFFFVLMRNCLSSTCTVG